MKNSGFEDFAETFGDVFAQAVTKISETGKLVITGLLDGLIANSGAVIQGISEAVLENIPILVDSITQLVEKISSFLAENAPTLLDSATQLFTGILDALLGVLDNLTSLLTQNIPVILNTAIRLFSAILDAFSRDNH